MSDLGKFMQQELESQPEVWAQAAALRDDQAKLPHNGERIAVVGSGTSWFMAQSYAALREQAGQGITDAFASAEFPGARDYDAVVALTRSGTTTEILELLASLPANVKKIGIVGDVNSPLPDAVDEVIALPFADEQSVVQTRFATTALTLMRAAAGDLAGVERSIIDAARVLGEEIPQVLIDAEQYSFLGRGWTVGLAVEAGLKMRESNQAWTESYSAMEYRHGPISIAAPGRVTWMIGETPEGLAAQTLATGVHFEDRTDIDPLADLVRLHRVALERSRTLGLDADNPRNLTRSVIIEA